MATYTSQHLLISLQDQTEQLLQKTSQWQLLPRKVLTYQASEQQWNAVQCLAHLNSYGSYYLPEIQKAIDKGMALSMSSPTHFTSGWLGQYFTQLMQPETNERPLKKMQSPKNHYPSVVSNPAGVIAVFIDQQEQLLALLKRAEQVNLGKLRIPISLTKWIQLKLGDVFLFLLAHEQRHILQAEKAIEACGDDVPSGLAVNIQQPIW